MSESARITLDDATKLYCELTDVKTLSRREVVIHTGKHSKGGCITLMQWGGDDFYTLTVMNDGELIPLTMGVDDFSILTKQSENFYSKKENAL